MLLSKVLQQYKTAVTREIYKIKHYTNFKRQNSFYDHVIRNDFSLVKIRAYIQNNPLKWEFVQENVNEVFLADKKIWRAFFRDKL